MAYLDFLLLPERSPQQPAIYHQVDRNHGNCKHKLDITRQAGRIDNRQDIVLDKTLRITLLPRKPAQAVATGRPIGRTQTGLSGS